MSKFFAALILRFLSPFAIFLSTAFQMDLNSFAFVIAFGEFFGIFALAVGPLTALVGSQVMILISSSMLLASLIMPLISTQYWWILLSRAFVGCGYRSLASAMQSYAGSHAFEGSSGKLTGLLECSWALASLLGMPVLGMLLERVGWKATFLSLFALFSPFAFLATYYSKSPSHTSQVTHASGSSSVYDEDEELALRTVQSQSSETDESSSSGYSRTSPVFSNSSSGLSSESDFVAPSSAVTSPSVPSIASPNAPSLNIPPPSVLEIIKAVLLQKVTFGAAVCVLLCSIADNFHYLIFAIFLSERYNLSAEGVGSTNITFGVAELLANIVLSLVSDRIGVHRSLVYCAISNIASYILIAWFADVNVVVAVSTFAFRFFVTEFLLSGGLAFSVELAPRKRKVKLPVSSSPSKLSSSVKIENPSDTREVEVDIEPALYESYRATAVSLFFATIPIGRMLGSVLAVPVYEATGWYLFNWVCAFLNVLSLAAVMYGGKPASS
eukprot:GILI01015848.1.p1 GENE.GILI01015848.1~~GILI01015848.1.p1  ORF type:complete len:573 (+),score=84.95 GILI01015848.1:228-1721(+)